MPTPKYAILYLFLRPTELIIKPKGEQKVGFDIPVSYWPERYQNKRDELLGRFCECDTLIPVKEMEYLPDFTIPRQLGRNDSFSIFHPKHAKAAAVLIEAFMNTETYEDFLSLATCCREQMNIEMFIYALSVAILHHPDTKDLPLPPLCHIFPQKYFDRSVIAQAREEATLLGETSREIIEIREDFTATDLDEEHRVAYWREDIGVNLHHWHWHLVYPFAGDPSVVDKDRRGELFYYMHEQIMARYNCERLCNRLNRVKRFVNWHEPILEGYFSNLDSVNTSRMWPARPTGIPLKEVHQPPDFYFDITDLERWRDRIYDAIHSGYVIDNNGKHVRLTEKDGIDILGNIIEAVTTLSINSTFYGNVHNLGHLAICVCHDPDYRYKQNFGVMGNQATAMRDPIFYRWHAFVNNIFIEYKNTLPAYSKEQLEYPHIEVEDIELTTNGQPNILNTFFTTREIDLSQGLAFADGGPIKVRYTHLDYVRFTYKIVVNNRDNAKKKGTVRIFMAPQQNERKEPFGFSMQKTLMIEMDKFSVEIPPGQYAIKRESNKSSVTVSIDRIFENTPDNYKTNPNDDKSNLDICKCGWPDNMLVPKGTVEGFPMDLFVMVSDYSGDLVEQDEPTGCKVADSYCGLRDRKYPDARPMGYPFDRPAQEGVETLADFLRKDMKDTKNKENMKNMKIQKVMIKFMDNSMKKDARSGSEDTGST
ncbi:phenoloxidase 1-like [Nomia melanderi]|uniref:phenoloxidase 1-like n=1 Tax=Nomia melanderi TaxID=2448451 RepID=UPI003FCE8999